MRLQASIAILPIVSFWVFGGTPPYTQEVFSALFLVAAILLSVDYNFFKVLNASDKPKAESLLEKIKENPYLENLRSLFKSTVLASIPLFFLEESILHLLSIFALPIVSINYFANLGRSFPEDFTDPEDYI